MSNQITLPPPGTDALQLAADVVVVGSGAGGAVAAATLAEAGLDVICVEEGAHHDTPDYTTNIPEMLGRLVRDAGLSAITGPRQTLVPYLEGRCVGGTTVINGGMCWRTPEPVLQRWVERGLPALAPERMAPLFAEIETAISARRQDPGSEGGNSLVIQRGAEGLGWRYRRNQRNQTHCVGSNECVTGCPSGAKESMLRNWIPRLLNAGGRLYAQCRVERLLASPGGPARGVEGVARSAAGERRLEISARAVVLAGGAIQTPLLLLRNRLDRGCNHVGRHFTIHPNVKVGAHFEEPVDPLFGTHQAFQVTQFQDQGILLAPGALPLPFLTMTRSSFGPRLAEEMRGHQYMAVGGVLVDDSASGRISLLPFGIPRIRYEVCRQDQIQFARAVAYMAELYFAAGAIEVHTPFHAIPLLRSSGEIPQIFAARPQVKDTEYFTAHLMGTCRMASCAAEGVVDPSGEMWQIPGLYIADASIMPGTIGVNPQLTIMAMARLVALGLAEKLTGA